MNINGVEIQKDLEAAVKELSHTYEELSLLYRLTEVLTGMGADEIAEQVVEEAVNSLGVRTAALLFFDEHSEKLHTKSFRGKWTKETVISKGDGIIWDAVTYKKPVAFCNLHETANQHYAHADGSVLVCPLYGKSRIIGAMLLADKEDGREFYSSDIKLLMAIANHASLTIENALLSEELEDFLISAIKSLVKALEASSRWTAGHTERVTEYAVGIGAVMGLNGTHIERLRICSLLHDIGKIAIPAEILNKADSLTKEEERLVRKHPLIGAEILGGFTQLQDVVHGIKYHHEWWDGCNGLLGLRGDDIPLTARILAVADSFDAMTSDRPYRRRKTTDEALEEINRFSGRQFDPGVVEAFTKWVSLQHPEFAP